MWLVFGPSPSHSWLRPSLPTPLLLLTPHSSLPLHLPVSLAAASSKYLRGVQGAWGGVRAGEGRGDKQVYGDDQGVTQIAVA